jgi:tripartite-type tricarboxylate transporter receptor subunit TctC
MGSAGVGTTNHVSGELFNMMAGVKMVHVSYRTAGSVFSDLVAAQVDVLFGTAAASIEFVKAGTLRPLAVTSATRWEALPGIPTVDETLRGYETTFFGGIVAPKATSAEIVGKLNKEVNAGLADPKLKARLAVLGGTVLPGSPEEFGKLIAEETEKWGKVVQAAGIKVE